MRPKDLTYLELNEMSDLLTITDRRKAPGSQPQEMVGVTLARPGFVLNRDFGTTNRFDSYPSSLSLRSAAVVFHQDRDEYWTLAVGIAENGDTEIWGFAPPLGMWGKLEPLPDEFEPNNGENPHIRWLVTDSITKFVVIIGDNYPLSIQWHDERTLYDDVIPEGWYAELHQLIPDSESIGTFDQGVQPEGDLGWDAFSYSYGNVDQDKVVLHRIINNGVVPVTINGFETTSDTHGESVPYFEITDDPTNDGADPVVLQPGEWVDVEVTANAISGEQAFTDFQECLLMAMTSVGTISKQLQGYFRDVI